MSLDRPIGGYFELELQNRGSVYHDNATALNSGRNALEYILIQRKPSRVLLPYYACDVLLQPIKRQNIEYRFYSLKNDFTPDINSLSKNTALLYINYFGVCSSIVEKLYQKYKNIIIDNSQAFYDLPLFDTSTFYSPRKFFGLPDGGFAYTPILKDIDFRQDESENRISHLIRRIEKSPEIGYPAFIQNESRLNNLPIRKMSSLSLKLLMNIDFKNIQKIRINNFNFLHKMLHKTNELTPLLNSKQITSPMIYPYLQRNNIVLRKKLIDSKIFVATYWPNVSKWKNDKSSYEAYLQNNLIPLPIDQRYSKEDMIKIIDLISLR